MKAKKDKKVPFQVMLHPETNKQLTNLFGVNKQTICQEMLIRALLLSKSEIEKILVGKYKIESEVKNG